MKHKILFCDRYIEELELCADIIKSIPSKYIHLLKPEFTITLIRFFQVLPYKNLDHIEYQFVINDKTPIILLRLDDRCKDITEIRLDGRIFTDNAKAIRYKSGVSSFESILFPS